MPEKDKRQQTEDAPVPEGAGVQIHWGSGHPLGANSGNCLPEAMAL